MSEENMTEGAKNAQEAAGAPETPSGDSQSKGSEKTPHTANGKAESDELVNFSREYVEELRDEAAKYRIRAKHTEEVERRLHDALVRLDGRLHDASDLAFEPTRLQDDGGVEEAITALIEAKPHLAKRTPKGDIGAGDRGETEAAPDLISIMRNL